MACRAPAGRDRRRAKSGSAIVIATAGGRAATALTARVFSWRENRARGSPVATLPQASCGGGTVVYTNDFNGLAGTAYPEWSAAPRDGARTNTAGELKSIEDRRIESERFQF